MEGRGGSRALASHLFCLMVVFGVFPAGTIAAQSFSDLPIKTADKGEKRLGEILAPAATVLVVGFSQSAGTRSAPWIEGLIRDLHSPKVKAFTVAVIATAPKIALPLAAFIVRSSVPSTIAPSLLLAETDESRWRNLVGQSVGEGPFVVILNATGSLVFREQTDYSTASYSALLDEIHSLYQ